MKTRIRLQIATAAMLACLLVPGGCATGSRMVTLDPVGPKPADVRPPGPLQGYLKVYNSTRDYDTGDLLYFPHTRYCIYLGDGTRYKWVLNKASRKDEGPEVVPLPVGAYYILARSEFDGLVKVPVVIRGGLTTVVNLERLKDTNGDLHGVEEKRAVKLPGGQVAGWKAPP